MAVILEGTSLVVPNSILQKKYRGGVFGFQANWDNGSFCTDGVVCRLAYHRQDDAFCAFLAMPDYGLDVSTHFATDMAVFLHGDSEWVPCLWLATDRTEQSHPFCWLVGQERGRLAVPHYFDQDATLATYADLSPEVLATRLSPVSEQDGVITFHDRIADRSVRGPRGLRRH